MKLSWISVARHTMVAETASPTNPKKRSLSCFMSAPGLILENRPGPDGPGPVASLDQADFLGKRLDAVNGFLDECLEIVAAQIERRKAV